MGSEASVSHFTLGNQRSQSGLCGVVPRKKRYSVPYRYAGQMVKIKETLDHHLEIYDERECIAKTSGSYRKKQLLISEWNTMMGYIQKKKRAESEER